MTGLVLLTGVGTGLGLWLILVGWFPRPPRLDKVLDAPDGPPQLDDPAAIEATAGSGWAARWGRPMVRWLRAGGLPTPGTRRDLATLDKPIEVHLAEQATVAVVGLLIPPVFGLLLAAAGGTLGLSVPAVLSLLLGTAGFLAPELSVRSDAAKYRKDFREALSAFLDLVVINLASGAGIDQALHEAARIGSGQPFTELRYALAEARLARVAPWDILAVLGQRIALPELRQLAASVGLAGTEGARIRASLRSRAAAMRERHLSEAEGEANAATERMALPMVALFAGFLIFIGYPAISTILTGF